MYTRSYQLFFLVSIALTSILIGNCSSQQVAIYCNNNDDCTPNELCRNNICIPKIKVSSEVYTSKYELPPIDRQDGGIIDEQFCQDGEVRSCYTGPDGTAGIGPCQRGQQECLNGEWGPCEEEVTPQKEICDGKDNDCDGVVDEGCCQNGETRPCYNGPSNTKDKGICKAGIQTCSKGEWGPCEGEVLPQKETCDGKDNNCNGQKDEGCNCIDGTTQKCYSGDPSTKNIGNCKTGIQTCSKGQWGPCKEEILPKAEKCNGKDDDCDGKIDEDFDVGKTCLVGQGMCTRSGHYVCDNDQKGSHCNATPGHRQPERCDGKDNDCDGDIDEDCTCTDGKIESCYDGPPNTESKGICKAGTHKCSQGKWGKCSGAILPQKEICNGKDDNCNGIIDDVQGVGSNCTVGQGSCQRTGKWKCDTSLQKLVCSAKAATPTTEICDGLDNNCNGIIDDVQGAGKPCTAGLGICKNTGQYICDTKHHRLICNAKLLPSKKETCNGKDDDCDGKIDNNIVWLNSKCFIKEKKGICARGQWTCKNGHANCEGPAPTTESCNNLDDDCDGLIDEDVYRKCPKQNCPGVIQRCYRGKWSPCIHREICRDKKDNDCDGKPDEICGKQYSYVLYYNKRFVSRNFSKITWRKPIYTLQSPENCHNKPIFINPISINKYPIFSSYQCIKQSNGGPAQYSLAFTYVHKKSMLTIKNYFSAVVPSDDKDEVWGVIDTGFCTHKNQKCKIKSLNSNNKETVFFERTGVYKLNSPLCDGQHALFLTINSKHTGFTYYTIHTDPAPKKRWCEIFIFNALRRPTNLNFAFWFPSSTKAAWALVGGMKGTVYNGKRFSDPSEIWLGIKNPRGPYYSVVFSGLDIQQNTIRSATLISSFQIMTSQSLILPTLNMIYYRQARAPNFRFLQANTFKLMSSSFAVLYVQ